MKKDIIGMKIKYSEYATLTIIGLANDIGKFKVMCQYSYSDNIDRFHIDIDTIMNLPNFEEEYRKHKIRKIHILN